MLLAAGLAALAATAGCTGDQLSAGIGDRGPGGGNLSVDVDTCSTDDGYTLCKLETVNRYDDPVRVNVTLQVVNQRGVTRASSTTTRIDRGRDAVSLTVPGRGGERNVSIRRVGDDGR